MPELDTQLHLEMLRSYQRENGFVHRMRRAVRDVVSPARVYGLQWGDPEVAGPQAYMRDHYVLPYVKPDHVGLEIGPGGGRWTQYLSGFRQLYVVDYHSELLQELRRSFHSPSMKFVVNNGTDFPGVPEHSVDYVISVACFVHLELHLIAAYLKNIAKILKPSGNVFLTYSDKTKIGAQMNPTFTDNTPERMRKMVLEAGFRIREEDPTVLWNSGIIRFGF
ncbi:MAG TPA: class I SAM-dependent methyltransferase [Candidatus Sulfotelmatobacter sp.]|nr:class I SAM-dependent methyltransferase [Candidatus Sulfotelmatobacter sp.]